ncbi:MAG: preprotein translocase subunit SecG [Desulfobacteraceae bacterium]|nr:MAG: preprotein translocase subunit SecG [Desulfobacteraceae bacterium]
MEILIITLHVIVCLALIMIVLLQTGKGADMGAAFGGGGSQTLFGSTGASTFLSKATTFAAIIFMLTCFTLAYISANRESTSIMEDVKTKVEQTAPMQASPDQTTTPAAAAKTGDPQASE